MIRFLKFFFTSMVHQMAKEAAVSWNFGLNNINLVQGDCQQFPHPGTRAPLPGTP